MSQDEQTTTCPDCGHSIRTVAGLRVAHDKDGLEPIGVGYWSGNNPEGVGHVQCLPKPEPYESFLAKQPAKTDWTPKLFWHLHDPPGDDPSIPTWELIAEIAGHRFGLATAWQERPNGTWAWCIQDTETCGDGTDPDGAVAFIREALPKWAAIIPDFPRELRIVVSGTGPDVAFVEVEDANGRSVAPDTMRDRPDGTRELVFFGLGGGR